MKKRAPGFQFVMASHQEEKNVGDPDRVDGCNLESVAGCSALTSGCINCYAMAMAMRLEAKGVEKSAGATRRSGKHIAWNGSHKRIVERR